MSITEIVISTDEAIKLLEGHGIKILYVPMAEYPISRDIYELTPIHLAIHKLGLDITEINNKNEPK